MAQTELCMRNLCLSERKKKEEEEEGEGGHRGREKEM